MTLERSVRYFYLRFLRMRKDPTEVARGLAVGVFVGLSPFFGFHMVAAVALAALLKGNKFIAILGTWIGNPLTFSFILFMDFKIGSWILGGAPEALKPVLWHPFEILHAGWNILFPMSIGGLLAGLLAGFLAYAVSNPLIRGIKTWMRKDKS